MKSFLGILCVLAVILASLVALNVFFHRALQMEMAEQFNKQQLLLARAEASNIQSYVTGIQDEMLHIAQVAQAFEIDEAALLGFLAESVFEDLGRLKMTARFLDSEGKVLFSRGSGEDEKASNLELVEIARGVCPSEAMIRQDTQRVLLVTPVCRSGRSVGALVVSIGIQDIAEEFLGQIKSGSRGYAWMMDGSGDLLFHPTQPDMVGRNLYQTDTSCFECHKSFDVEKKIIEGKGDYYGKYVAPSGEDKVLAFATASVGDSKWIVAVSAPYSEVTMSMQSSMRFHSWLTILIFLTTSGISAMLIVMNRKRVKAEEIARHQKQLEKYAEELEYEVDERIKELSSEKEKLNSIISTIASGIMLVDSHRKIQWTNQQMKDIAGKDITGMKCDEIFDDCTILSSYAGKHVQTDVLSDIFREERVYQVTTAPVLGTKGEDHGYIRLIQDVTGIRKMEEQMMHSEKLALLERLTASITQEMDNPLTSVSSFIEVLRRMEKDEFKRESLETISLHMDRIADILKQLSGFSKTPTVKLRPWKVHGLLEDALSLIQYDERVKNITIVRDFQPGFPEITTDGNHLSQVVVDIVLNAADAMPEGGTLTIRNAVKDENVIITVEDTGMGIPEENLGKIFEPFFTTKDKGTGLGLSVGRTIIQKLGGTLTVASESGKGSRFVITLPRNGV
jgi:signal transduction histidine kinase